MKKIIGLDIGGTKIEAILRSGTKVEKTLTVGTKKNLADFQKEILNVLFRISDGQKYPVGVGVAGLVDKKKGIVTYSPNMLFLNNFTFAKFLQKNGYKKVLLDNDAACFTLAELKLGVGKKYKNFLGMTLGTGIGGGIVIESKMYRGFQNFGGEFGSMVVEGGRLESQFQVARDAGDFAKLGYLVGLGCVNLTNIFNPEAIVFGGGVAKDFEKFEKYILTTLKEKVNPNRVLPKFSVSKIKNVGALGATFLFR